MLRGELPQASLPNNKDRSGVKADASNSKHSESNCPGRCGGKCALRFSMFGNTLASGKAGCHETYILAHLDGMPQDLFCVRTYCQLGTL